MTRLALAFSLAVPLFVPALASANPVTLGASLGMTQDDVDAEAGYDATQTLGLWGRLGFSSRVSGQLEITRFKSEAGCDTCTFGTTTDIRIATGLLVVDLANQSAWVPVVMVGAGLDRDDGSFPTTGHHYEGGFGLEYRGTEGVMIGADVRLGGRSLDQQVYTPLEGDVIGFVPARQLNASEYRSARIVIGLRF